MQQKQDFVQNFSFEKLCFCKYGLDPDLEPEPNLSIVGTGINSFGFTTPHTNKILIFFVYKHYNMAMFFMWVVSSLSCKESVFLDKCGFLALQCCQ
jgi:hypothetical protein